VVTWKSRRYWQKLLLFAFSILVIGLLGGTTLMFRQGALGFVHPARSLRSAGDTPARLGVSYQEIALTTTDGLKLAAWYTPPQNGRVILVAHGYADKRSTDLHALFARNKYGVLSWDFRAHGESEGNLCTLGYYETRDVEAALDFALSQPEVSHVGAWGGSMGGVATILAAAHRPEIEAVVVDSAFSTLEDEIAVRVPSAIMRPFIRFFAEQETGISAQQVRPIDQIGRISPRPVLIIQGLADKAIPLDSAQRLYNAAGEPRTLWQENGVDHVAMFSAQPQEYEERVVSFLNGALSR
jgi:dipeptidyl aminopeptidase/acylaminoacyl peptidase